jgi:hypothetical protein
VAIADLGDDALKTDLTCVLEHLRAVDLEAFAELQGVQREREVPESVFRWRCTMDRKTQDTAAECAREARKQVALLAPGKVRDALVEKAKQYEAETRQKDSR